MGSLPGWGDAGSGADGVQFLGFVPERDLPALYATATVFAYPSLDEGFGMPVLEAMTIGVPVVASNRGALPEVLGDAGLLVDPCDEDGLAGAMDRMLNDRPFAERCVDRGFHRAATYTWSSSAVGLLRAYGEAIARRRERS